MKRSLFNISMIAASLILQNSYATDYNQISRQIKDSVNVGQLLTEEKAVANIEAYEGANVDELKYYNNEGNMNDDAQSNMVDDQNFDTLLKSSDASSEYDIDLDEDWLQNTFNISSQPFETLDIITSTYSDCVGNQRSCSFYQGLN